MACKGICHRYKAKKPPVSLTRYGEGQKRCNPCGVFLKHDGINCPCCGMILRTTPREGKSRRKYIVNDANRL